MEEHLIVEDDPLHVVGQARTDLGDLVPAEPAPRSSVISRAAGVRGSDDQD